LGTLCRGCHIAVCPLLPRVLRNGMVDSMVYMYIVLRLDCAHEKYYHERKEYSLALKSSQTERSTIALYTCTALHHQSRQPLNPITVA
jgi:hypothetical protein